jgi:hypothetical protein
VRFGVGVEAATITIVLLNERGELESRTRGWSKQIGLKLNSGFSTPRLSEGSLFTILVKGNPDN